MKLTRVKFQINIIKIKICKQVSFIVPLAMCGPWAAAQHEVFIVPARTLYVTRRVKQACRREFAAVCLSVCRTAVSFSKSMPKFCVKFCAAF
jgi:hypothetical protein